ncbi:ABC transporter permease [Paenibacillus sp. GSMTC-2017]|uniref:ABC transporter permease n=1 Tax=Paenibacillus sp. GSMTC-2017 TaxID=2794350 RepID=UPI0018D83417|nr:ABC transporter permease [Paenibacillus sp. GSMTC-2017]MBH5319429.1 ABC transporter permease [Paenibacillus sp. GSMTC-2017]
MTFSIRRVSAIVAKDVKDLLKNSYIILITIFLPLGLAAMLSRSGSDDASLLGTPINLALVITGAFVQATMMAEEKEKNTLRALLLSPATRMEIMIGKSFLSSLITILVVIGSIFISQMQVPELFYFTIMILLSLIIFISLGTIIGLVSRTVMETSIVGLPLLVIFTYGSMISTMLDNDVVSTIITYLPTESFSSALISLEQNGGFSEIKWHLLNMLLWAIGSLVIAVIVYGKRRFDK